MVTPDRFDVVLLAASILLLVGAAMNVEYYMGATPAPKDAP